MYKPKHFVENDSNTLYDLIQQHPFASVVIHTSKGLEAAHIPLHIKDKDTNTLILQGHIAKANPLHQLIPGDGCEALGVFKGANTYISPNYYPSKKQHGKAVPTWNYLLVQAKGHLSLIDDKAWKLDFLNRLSKQHEAKQTEPWSINDAPEDYINTQLRALVGLEIQVKQLEGVRKLSQNQSAENREGVIEGLSKIREPDAQEIAQAIQKTIEET